MHNVCNFIYCYMKLFPKLFINKILNLHNMSLKLLLPKSDSEFSIDPAGSFRKASIKSFILHARRHSIAKKPEVRIIKVAKENAVSYEEFLEILQKPHIFIINWSGPHGTGCWKKLKFTHFEIQSLAGSSLLKGKYNSDSIRVVDNRSRLFMILTYTSGDGEATLSVPNSSIHLATIKRLPSYIPYNKHFQMISEHFPELNCNIEQQTLPGRYSGSMYKYTVTQGRRVVCKLLQPSKGDQMYVLVDESVSVFQKSGLLAASIFVSQRPHQNMSKLICIGLIFTLVFIFGLVVVASTVLDLRYKNPEFDANKFKNQMKAPDHI